MENNTQPNRAPHAAAGTPRPRPPQGQAARQGGNRPPMRGQRPASRDGHHQGGNRGSHSHARGGNHFEKTRDRVMDVRYEKAGEQKKRKEIPALGKGDIRVIIFSGVQEIGRNMAAIEFGDDIVIVDCGLQFKDETTPGIDYILPNTTYLEERKDKIRGVFITHGHLDHTGGLPYILPRIGNPPVYARKLTSMLVKKRHDEFPSLPPLDLRVVETEDTVRFKDLAVRFFKVTHTIPDSMGVMVDTPHGTVIHTGDLKLDHKGGIATEEEERTYGKFRNEKILLLMSDSTNCQKAGFSIPEPTVHVTIEKLIKEAHGRVIVATFASLLERIIKVIEFADTHGKKICIDGRSMKTNIELAQKAGIFTLKPGTVIPVEDLDKYPPDRVVMLVTGAQGDEFAVLMRIAMKKHRQVKIKDGDTILFSSSVVPGNERAVQKLKDLLSRQGAKIVHYETSDVHSSGHAYRDEALWIMSKVSPRFFVPLHGYHYMLRSHVDIAFTAGVPKENAIIPDNGSIMEIRENGTKFVKLPVMAPNEMVAVDGFNVGNIQEAVVRDRQMLASDGIVVLVATVDMQTGKIMKSPDIIARGFVYVRESHELLNHARLIIKKTIEDACGKDMNGVNFEFLKEDLRDKVGKFFFQKTMKQPMVIPVLLGM